jgi:hypothetical protein
MRFMSIVLRSEPFLASLALIVLVLIGRMVFVVAEAVTSAVWPVADIAVFLVGLGKIGEAVNTEVERIARRGVDSWHVFLRGYETIPLPMRER